MTYSKDYSKEYSKENLEKLNAVYDRYVKQYTPEEKKKLFNNLNTKTITAILKGYTNKMRLKAKPKYAEYSAYELLHDHVYIERMEKKILPKYTYDMMDFMFRTTLVGGYVRFVSSFRYSYMKKIVDLLESEYNIKFGTIYDYSCGWGTRLLYCIKNKYKYYGTEPNKELVDKLKEIIADYNLYTGNNYEDNIYCQGSEVTIPELTNTIDLCFSSPPYYDKEIYSNDESQSIIQNGEKIDYENWLTSYVKPTLENCYKYNKQGGFLVVNITFDGGFDYEGDWQRLAEEAGYTFIKKESIFNATLKTNRKNPKQKHESFLIFRKV